MKAICITSAGDLEPCDRPAPVPGEGEVLIKVAASGMNRADLLQTKGQHPPPPGASDLPGLEVSGTISAVGPSISDAMIGERVCALLDGGGYAEYAVARLDLCLPVPPEMDLIACAGLPEAIFTVTKNVFLMGQLRPDEHLLIHGGASGIGTLAIQMAKSVGAFVTVTAGTDAKCQLCRELGADRAINYKTEDFEAVLKGTPVDVVFDMVGGDYVKRSLAVLQSDGRHISIAYMRGKDAEIDLAMIMKKRLTVTGSTLRHDSAEDKKTYAEMLQDIFWPEVIDGKIRPHIHATYPLTDAARAHADFARGEHTGKILLIPAVYQ